jgi:hypothetical protein
MRLTCIGTPVHPILMGRPSGSYAHVIDPAAIVDDKDANQGVAFAAVVDVLISNGWLFAEGIKDPSTSPPMVTSIANAYIRHQSGSLASSFFVFPFCDYLVSFFCRRCTNTKNMRLPSRPSSCPFNRLRQCHRRIEDDRRYSEGQGESPMCFCHFAASDASRDRSVIN